MSFTDLLFIFTFLPVALLLYYAVPGSRVPAGREWILLAVSLVFYACGSPRYLVLLVISLMINVVIARRIQGAAGRSVGRFFLIAGIIFNVGLLGYYKYFDFSISISNRLFGTAFTARNLLLPLGLSFYTFKAISLFADLYRGNAKECSARTMALYLSFFGQISSGPIARIEHFQPAGKRGEGKADLSMLTDGITRFLTGFSKKVLLSNVLSNVVMEIFDQTAALSTSLAWLGAVCFSLQLYYDFSGYSDMAVGVAQMFGYTCPENFNYPYMTRSIAEFWRRWHMTLGSWFRDYIYIPMGGSRVGRLRLYMNLLTVWILTGLWHGANWNFIIWGLGYFAAISLEKAFALPGRFKTQAAKILYRVFALFFIVLEWVMFRVGSFSQGRAYIRTMLIPTSLDIPNARAAFLLGDYKWVLAAAVLFAVPVVPFLREKCREGKGVFKGTFPIYQAVSAAGLLLCFAAALSLVISGQNNPFLYANF